MIYPPRPTTNQKKWTASNTITITLGEVDRAGGLTDLLNSSGATNVYGPNFSLDQKNLDDSAVLIKAVNDARTRAEKVAEASGRSLGKVITITEGSSYNPPIFATMEAGRADTKSIPAPVEPGTQTVSKSVTVTFELK